MPKYVFEVSATLPRDQVITLEECNAINRRLAEHLALVLANLGKSGKIRASEPFEHVSGPDAQPIHAHV